MRSRPMGAHDGPMTTIDSLSTGKYLSLTTFKKDGSAVATPVWLARDGDVLRVITESESGKAKRIRNGGRVLVAPCDMRGKISGEQVEATAVLQNDDDTKRTASLIRARYGLLGRLLMMRAERAARKAGHTTQVGITITIP